MKCPRCGLTVMDVVPKCQGCSFSISDLDQKLRRVPERVGFVNDFAQMLSADERASLDAELAQLSQKLGGELVLVTVPSTKPVKPSEYVFYLFNRWQVGGENHAGLMVLLAKKERRVESEVGYAWEPIISDVGSGEVLDAHVVPPLKEDKIYEALHQGIKHLGRILEQAVTLPEEPSVSQGGEE